MAVRRSTGSRTPALFVSIGFLLLCAEGPAQQPNSAPSSPVVTTPALSYRLTNAIELPGSVEARLRTQVSSPVAGMVTALTVREGDRVERDQTLAELDTEFLQARRATIVAQMQEAKARREGAELSLRRAQELFDAALIAAEDLDKAEVELNALDARVVSLEASMAEIDLGIEGSVIRAPFDGAVSEKLTEVGGWIRTGDPVLELVSADDLEVSAEVPEIHFSKLRVGQKAQVRLEALPGKTLTGQVQATAPEADPQARTFAVKVAVQSNGGLVRPGMVATVKFAPSAPRTVTLVPKDALVERAEGWVVFAADANNEAVLRQVRLGDSVGEWTEVVGRVRPGDQVVILGNERLRDGEKLAPRTRELPAP